MKQGNICALFQLWDIKNMKHFLQVLNGAEDGSKENGEEAHESDTMKIAYLLNTTCHWLNMEHSRTGWRIKNTKFSAQEMR